MRYIFICQINQLYLLKSETQYRVLGLLNMHSSLPCTLFCHVSVCLNNMHIEAIINSWNKCREDGIFIFWCNLKQIIGFVLPCQKCIDSLERLLLQAAVLHYSPRQVSETVSWSGTTLITLDMEVHVTGVIFDRNSVYMQMYPLKQFREFLTSLNVFLRGVPLGWRVLFACRPLYNNCV